MSQSSSSTLRFVADATLGKLAKHLRLSGFDTLLDTQVPEPGRLALLADDRRTVLTRSHKVRRALAGMPLIFIQANDPWDQFRQIMRELDLRLDDLHPLTRCARCNSGLDVLPHAEALGKVPDYVCRHHAQFKICPDCERIYWPGSHAQRWRDQAIRMFDGV